MSLESVDFQSIVHQQVSILMGEWHAAGLSETDIQEIASQFHNFGLIAGGQMQQEGGIQPQGTQQVIPYTPQMAERVSYLFLRGLHAAILKAHEQKLPSTEKWQLMQNVAYHVFEHSKQIVVATLGQEHTPDVQISEEQILNWLSQTAIEALLYYLNEYEKQNGPITRLGEAEAFPVLHSPQEEAPPPMAPPAETPAPVAEPPATSEQQPLQETTQAALETQSQAIPEIHHKFAALGLLLSSLPNSKQQSILAAFQPDEQQLIQYYRNPEVIAQHLDLGLVAKYLRLLKEKMGQGKSRQKSQYATPLAGMIQTLPAKRVERLFQSERPFVRGYVGQLLSSASQKASPYTLPQGVEEALLLYIQRNFPEASVIS